MGEGIASVRGTGVSSESDADSAVARWRRRWPALLVVSLLVGMTIVGISYRRWAWDFSEPGRYWWDVQRNFSFGVSALQNGYLNMYENQVRDQPSYYQRMDYPPLRLLTFEIWAASKLPGHNGELSTLRWSRDYDFNAGLMRYYTVLEWLAAAAAFLIVLTWLRKCRQAQLPGDSAMSPWTGLVRATFAFALLWFDPGVVIIAHGWPSPNMWVLPFYLWAVLLCLWDFWFIAGMVLAIGCLLQGQILLVAAIFVLWPLFAGEWARVLRGISGFAMTFMLVISGWMITYRPDIQSPERHIHWPAIAWIASGLALFCTIGFRRTLFARRLALVLALPAMLAMAAVLIWPAIGTGRGVIISAAVVISLALFAVFWICRWSTKRYVLALAAGGMLACCMLFFHGSTAWWTEGFLYGADRFGNVGSKMVANLASAMGSHMGWNSIRDTAFRLPQGLLFGWPESPIPVNVRQMLLSIYIPLFIAAGFAIARQWRQRSRNLLIAIVLPWVLFYTLLPQLSPRYAVYVAGIGAICVGANLAMPLLIWLFSALTVMQTTACMMAVNKEAWNGPNPLFNNNVRLRFLQMNSELAGAEIVAAGILFALAFICHRNRRASEQSNQAPLSPVI